jgi:porphobilinogen synthase
MSKTYRALSPDHRLRRNRRTDALRKLVREHTPSAQNFVYPVFVREGKGVKEEIGAMPGQFRYSPDTLAKEAPEIASLGIPAILLFGLTETKDELGTSSADPEGAAQQAIRAVKRECPDLAVITDVCLCAYTTHGHCGVVRDGYVANDETLPLLAKMAVSHAQAGADVVAPSAMMDGQVQAIREALDDAGLASTAVMGYSAKFASAFYGPFREAADSAPQFGDRRSYQMDPPNVREALREVWADVEQGADYVMVKPALAYLDVVRAVREEVDVPIAVYNVSGEYSMVKAAAERGWIDERTLVLEMLTAFRRAGADIVITYYAKEAARWLAGI